MSLKDSAYINWNKGLYATTTYKKFIEQVEQPEVGTIKMSMGAYKISTILKYIHKWNNDDKKPPLKEIFIYLGAKLEQNPDEWLVDDKNGLPFQQELLDIGPPKNEEGKVIDMNKMKKEYSQY